MEVIGGRGRHPQGVRRAKGSSASQHKPMKHFMVATFPTRWDYFMLLVDRTGQRERKVCAAAVAQGSKSTGNQENEPLKMLENKKMHLASKVFFFFFLNVLKSLSIITPVFSVTWFFRNHYNMLIFLLKKHLLLLVLKTVHILWKQQYFFFSGNFKRKKSQRTAFIVISVTFDLFNLLHPWWIKVFYSIKYIYIILNIYTVTVYIYFFNSLFLYY